MSASHPFLFLRPAWDGVAGVHAFSVVAEQDAATVDFQGDTERGREDRRAIEAMIAPRHPIHWLDQPHGGEVVVLPQESRRDADASITTETGLVCAIKTADCLPLLIASESGEAVAAVHGGWKSLKSGIIENTLARMAVPRETLRVWLGPAISGASYEVGPDLVEAFCAYAAPHLGVFKKAAGEKFHMDIYALARHLLVTQGVAMEKISGGDFCTFRDPRLASYRRDGVKATRMGSFIWKE